MTVQALIQSFVQTMLQTYKVDIRFKQGVIDEDLKQYGKGDITKILKAIVQRFKENSNPHNINPNWLLRNDLLGSVKIRLLDEGIRVVYRVQSELATHTEIHIYAIGPRKGELAYAIAKKRKDW